MKEEQWKPVPGFWSRYEVSNRGRVRSFYRGRTVYMKLYNSHGYLRARFSFFGVKTFKQVHRLVLEAFGKPCPKGYQCDHVNGDKTDNHIENLRWVTPSENTMNPVTNVKRKHPCRSVLCVETGETFPSLAEAARKIGVSRERLYAVVHGKRYCRSAGGLTFRFVEVTK